MVLPRAALGTVTLGAVALGAVALGAMTPTFGTALRMAAAPPYNTGCDTLFEFFQLKVQVSHLVSPPFWFSSVKPCNWRKKMKQEMLGSLCMTRSLLKRCRK